MRRICGKKLHSTELFVGAVHLRKRQTQLTGSPLGIERTAAAEPDVHKRNIAVMCGDKLVRNAVRY